MTDRIGEVARLFTADPAEVRYPKLFAPPFLAAVPQNQLTALLRLVYRQGGRCVGVTPDPGTSATQGRFRLTFEKGFAAVVTASVEVAEPHRIDGFWIGPLQPTVASFPVLIDRLRHLPGTTALYAARLADDGTPTPLAAHEADRPLAIGSTFKLYVLSELARQVNAGRRRWDDVVRLDPAHRSLPSGQLQTWPAGSPVTLHSLATLMISQSDNTAADELLATLGRSEVEAVLPAAGHARPALDQPFLTTGEVFRIKSDAELADRYARGDTAARRALLAGPVASVPADAIRPYADPRHVADVEWLASASDLARAMRYLRDLSAPGQPAEPARAILAVNPGLPIDPRAWPYVGFKGGSEPGVMSLTYLLRSRSGGWFVLSVGWNNPSAVLDESQLTSLALAGIDLLAKAR